MYESFISNSSAFYYYCYCCLLCFCRVLLNMQLHQGSYPCSVEVMFIRIIISLINDILLIVLLMLLQLKGSTKRNIPMLCQSPIPPPPHLHPHCSLDNVADAGLWKHPLMLCANEALRDVYPCSVEVILIFILIVLWVMLQTRDCGSTRWCCTQKRRWEKYTHAV